MSYSRSKNISVCTDHIQDEFLYCKFQMQNLTATASLTSTTRVQSIDLLRGLIMIIMALDHTRDFFHHSAFTEDPLNPATTTPALYFTRWITHLCAPGFVFLSGASVWLQSRKKTKKELSIFLIKRGLWLILLEVTLVNFVFSFDAHFNEIALTVIWAIGISMVILGLLIWLTLSCNIHYRPADSNRA